MDDLEFDIIYDKIHVYKNLIPNVEEMLNDLIEIETPKGYSFGPWEGWYTFGKQRPMVSPPNPEPDDVLNKYAKLSDEILLKTTRHFMDYYGMDQDATVTASGHICKYEPLEKKETGPLMTMTYHVDYQQEKEGQPGTFHYVTCNMYLNDDYEGGEICFSVGEDHFEYKPKAGDIILFPSRAPYYHGVRKTYVSPKYFFRTFMMKEEKPSAEWLEGKEKYGEQLWNEMEIEREISIRKSFVKHQDYQEQNVKLQY